MATRDELISAISALLDHPLGVERFDLARDAADKAYEAYVFGLCLRAVREVGAVIHLRGIASEPDTFIFRGAPGKIYSQNRNYGYALFEFNGHVFEIHNGVEFKGNSGVTHEIDVSILHQKYAERCRYVYEDPPAKSLFAGFECKFYATALKKSLAREFVGTLDDMGAAIRIKGLCSNSDSESIRQYLSRQHRPDAYFMLEPNNGDSEHVFVEQLKFSLIKFTGGIRRT